MKRIKLDIPIIDELGIIDGGVFTLQNGNEATIKDILINHCGFFQAQDGEQAIQSIDLGIKIKNATDSIILEDAELKFLKNGPLKQAKFASIVMSQIFKALDSAETVDPNEKKDP